MTWLISMVNPPPLHLMSRLQKIARVILFTITLLMLCILTSMFAAVGIFAFQHASHMFSGIPQLVGDIGIVFVSMLVNTLCVLVLLKVKSADEKLIPPTEPPTQPGGDTK